MKYIVQTTSGHVITLRGVKSFSYESEARTLDTKHYSRKNFRIYGVTHIDAGPDDDTWIHGDITIKEPGSGGAPLPAGLARSLAAESAVPEELATTTFAPLEELAVKTTDDVSPLWFQMMGRAQRYAPGTKPVGIESIPLENFV